MPVEGVLRAALSDCRDGGWAGSVRTQWVGADRISRHLDGETPLVFVPGWVSNVDSYDDPWGEGALIELFGGSIAEVDGVREWWGRNQRTAASPTMAKLVWQALMEIDVRDVLSAVETPTLVLHRRGDRVAPYEAAAAMA